jgi:glycosyltransferase involved in cell wall biosynthesis
MREAHECAYFEKFVQLYLNDRIVYLGEVDHDRKMALLADATALLFPIRWNEPFGLVMIEALACGTPVLAFPEGAAPEVIEDGKTGFLCQDEAELAEAIAAVPALDRLACRLAVEDHFCTRRMVAEYVQLYRDIIDRGTGTARDGNLRASGFPAIT